MTKIWFQKNFKYILSETQQLKTKNKKLLPILESIADIKKVIIKEKKNRIGNWYLKHVVENFQRSVVTKQAGNQNKFGTQQIK